MVAADCEHSGYFPQPIQSAWTCDSEQAYRISTYDTFCLHTYLHDCFTDRRINLDFYFFNSERKKST